MTYEKNEAQKFLADLFVKGGDYRMAKVSAKEGRPLSVYIGEEARGPARVLPVADHYPEWIRDYGYSTDDFCVIVQGPGFHCIRTSPVQRVGVTPDGILLAETENSIYRLEKVKE